MENSFRSSAQIVRDLNNFLSVEGQIIFALLHEEVHISILRKYVKTSRSNLYKKVSELISRELILYVSRPKVNGELHLKLNSDKRNEIINEFQLLLNGGN